MHLNRLVIMLALATTSIQAASRAPYWVAEELQTRFAEPVKQKTQQVLRNLYRLFNEAPTFAEVELKRPGAYQLAGETAENLGRGLTRMVRNVPSYESEVYSPAVQALASDTASRLGAGTRAVAQQFAQSARNVPSYTQELFPRAVQEAAARGAGTIGRNLRESGLLLGPLGVGLGGGAYTAAYRKARGAGQSAIMQPSDELPPLPAVAPEPIVSEPATPPLPDMSWVPEYAEYIKQRPDMSWVDDYARHNQEKEELARLAQEAAAYERSKETYRFRKALKDRAAQEAAAQGSWWQKYPSQAFTGIKNWLGMNNDIGYLQQQRDKAAELNQAYQDYLAGASTPVSRSYEDDAEKAALDLAYAQQLLDIVLQKQAAAQAKA